MEDCRVFGTRDDGMQTAGAFKATRCIFEDNERSGLVVCGFGGEARLVECVVRNNGANGLRVCSSGEATLAGGKINNNKEHGVFAYGGGQVTAAKRSEEVDLLRPQTVSTGDGGHNWATRTGALVRLTSPTTNGRTRIGGLAEGIQVVAVEEDLESTIAN